MAHIIFICTGNICRSPIAEGILKKRLHEMNRDDMVISSMGIHGIQGHPASDYALEICQDEGIDLSEHISRSLIPDELVKSDLVLTMEVLHNEFIYSFFPRIKEKTFLLGSWPEVGSNKNNIQDPIGSSINKYRKAFKEINFHISRILPLVTSRFPLDSTTGKLQETPTTINT